MREGEEEDEGAGGGWHDAERREGVDEEETEILARHTTSGCCATLLGALGCTACDSTRHRLPSPLPPPPLPLLPLPWAARLHTALVRYCWCGLVWALCGPAFALMCPAAGQAVVSHKGRSAAHGHYVSDIFVGSKGHWNRYDDATVTALGDARSAQALVCVCVCVCVEGGASPRVRSEVGSLASLTCTRILMQAKDWSREGYLLVYAHNSCIAPKP
jgi:hypothetical protein